MRTASISGVNVTTTYGHDGQTVVAEYLGSCLASAPQRKYINASYVDEPVLLIDRTAAGSVGAGTDERFYYHRNQQYSITALCDNTGTVVERYAYTAYGEPTILDGVGTTTRTTSFINNPYLYTARAYDAETGMYYFRARMYEGRKGRFLGHDPILYPDGYNTYAGWFAASMLDPDGEESCEEKLIKCYSKCWNGKPIWPADKKTKVGRLFHYQYCDKKCKAEYAICLGLETAEYVIVGTFATMCDAMEWVKNNPGKAAVGTVVIVGGAFYMVSTGGTGAVVLIAL